MQISSISYVKLRVFVHATEDFGKVVQAVKNLFNSQIAEEIKFKKIRLSGHHGNPIVLLEAKIKERKIIKALIERLSSDLNASDREFLTTNFEQHTKKGSLYLRFDKQSAFDGKVKFSSSDPIHLRIGFKTGKTSEMKKVLGELGVLV